MAYEYKPNFKKRILATILDLTIYWLLYYLYLGFFGEATENGGFAVWNFKTVPLFIIWFVYFVVIEGTNGATLGHHAFNLKVLTVKRDKIGMTEALIRHVLDIIDIYWYGIPALIAIKYTEKHQRLGDLVAKTIVVDTEDLSQYNENKTPIFEKRV